MAGATVEEEVTSPLSSDTSHSDSLHEEGQLAGTLLAAGDDHSAANTASDGMHYAEPRPASKPEKHVIYKSMNFLPFTTRFEMLKQGSSMRLVDLNPRQAVRIYDERPPEFSHKKCRVLKYVTMPSDSSSSSESDSSDSSQTTYEDSPHYDVNNNQFEKYGASHENSHDLVSIPFTESISPPCLAAGLEEEEVDVTGLGEAGVSEAAKILLSLAHSQDVGGQTRSIATTKASTGSPSHPHKTGDIFAQRGNISISSELSLPKTTVMTSNNTTRDRHNAFDQGSKCVNVQASGSTLLQMPCVVSAQTTAWVNDTQKALSPSLLKYSHISGVIDGSSPHKSSVRQACRPNLHTEQIRPVVNSNQEPIHQSIGSFWRPKQPYQEVISAGKTQHGSMLLRQNLPPSAQPNCQSPSTSNNRNNSFSQATIDVSNPTIPNSTYLLSPGPSNMQHQRQQIHIPALGQPGVSGMQKRVNNSHVSVIRVISPRIPTNLQAKFNNEGLLCRNKPALSDKTSGDEPDFESFASLWHALTVDVAGNTVHRCILCNKIYTIYQAYKNHVQLHFRQRNKCSVCGKTFSRPWLLKGHMRTHTGERPYKCEHPGCSKAFADRSNLRSHSMIHKVNGKEYRCGSCDRAFAQKRYLHKHMAEVCKAGTNGSSGDRSIHNRKIATAELPSTSGSTTSDETIKPCVLGKSLQKYLPKANEKESSALQN